MTMAFSVPTSEPARSLDNRILWNNKWCFGVTITMSLEDK